MQQKQRILLVEDDLSFGKILKDYLSLNGFDVTHVKDGIEGWSTFRNYHFDLCILDIMMPKRDGFELAEMVRESNKKIPLFFLTAKTQKHDMLAGYESGADDYLVKPVDAEILLHKIKAVLKRAANPGELPAEESIFDVGGFKFNHTTRSLTCDKNTVLLSPKEADLLRLFCTNKNQLVKREEILSRLWKEVNYFTGRSLDVYVVKLRKYLQADKNISLNNIHKSGYILEVKNTAAS